MPDGIPSVPTHKALGLFLSKWHSFQIHKRALALQAIAAEYFFTLMFIFLATGTVTSGCHSADTGKGLVL